MHTQRKIALALLSFALALPVLHAKPRPQNGPAADPGAVPPPADPAGPPPGDNWGGPGGGRDYRFNRGGWGGDEMGMRGHGMFGRDLMLARLVDNPSIREQLGITADQAGKIRQQTTDFEKSAIQGRADVEVKRLELRDLLAADNPDRSAIDQKLTEISSARLVQEKSAVDFHLAMRSALTPEQRQKLDQMRDRFRGGGFGGRRQGSRGPRPGSSQAPPASPTGPSDGN
ncbi:MAG TPA: periplasmic heavy metal sensor [Candidatus Acidoferrum sp.]|nr:periplasmic heavy metal sensor [Candidatus Acidoferrum sp.]